MDNKTIQLMAANHASSMVDIMGYEINIYGAIIIAMIAIFLLALYKAQKKKRLDWMDMITRDGKTVSTTKILQLVGGFVATWIVIKMTLQGQLNWDIFAIYLAYVASIDSFSKLIIAKYQGGNGSNGGGYMGGGFQNYNGYPPQQTQNQGTVNTTPAVVAPPTQDEQVDTANDHASRGAAKPPQD